MAAHQDGWEKPAIMAILLLLLFQQKSVISPHCMLSIHVFGLHNGYCPMIHSALWCSEMLSYNTSSSIFEVVGKLSSGLIIAVPFLGEGMNHDDDRLKQDTELFSWPRYSKITRWWRCYKSKLHLLALSSELYMLCYSALLLDISYAFAVQWAPAWSFQQWWCNH